MIWIIISITLYTLTCGIALFLICSGDKERGIDAYYDVRNIGVACSWPLILLGLGAWKLGKRVFKDKENHDERRQN
jgi:hypothetical protein